MTNVLDVIDKKRRQLSLNEQEIIDVVEQYLDGDVADYQMSSLLMSMCCNGLNQDEINSLTKAYIESGDVIDLSSLTKPTVDKHSTGGVGDKTSLLIAPILACFGVDVAKMSGRGLGFTGGTLDKLEAIEGFNINLDETQFIRQVNDIGLAIISQSGDVVPADKKIYALRDVTGTVDSIGLIAASIMSKKIASGAQHICLDIKCGSGAFMKDLTSARELASTLIAIGRAYDKKVCAIISTMDQPLGVGVGNSIEVMEVVNTLNGHGPNDLVELATNIVINLLDLCDIKVTREQIFDCINGGAAYQKFIEFITAQGGSLSSVEQLHISDQRYVYTSPTTGYVEQYKVDLIGKAAQVLGAGRQFKDDIIDNEVGISCPYKIGDFINEGDSLFTIYYHDKTKLQQSLNYLAQAFSISETKVESTPIILDVVKE